MLSSELIVVEVDVVTIYFYSYSITVVPIFPPLQSSTHPIPYFHNQYPHSCPCPWVIHTCSLTSPFPFLLPLFPSPFHSLDTVSVFQVSMSLVPFRLLVYFVHLVPLVSEITWYLSFTNWLISLSMIFSSSTHAVTKCRSSLFLSAV